VNYDNSLVVTITVTCYSWAPSSGEHLFTCGAISRPPQQTVASLVHHNHLWNLMSRNICDSIYEINNYAT